MKKLIICPSCEKSGKKEVLGEIKETGEITVLRFHKGETKIKSANMEII
jgi:hypothetical protein